MAITVKYFGLIAELTGKSEELFSLEINSIALLKSKLEELYPEIKNTVYSVAVNRSIVNETILSDNDEIALLPPFAGG